MSSQAKEGFAKFYSENPETKNPTDINSQLKLDFFVKYGFGLLWDMQEARKQNTEKNGKPNPWTRLEYWR